ncbi:hypothetical protein AVEN_128129-1 [Araneus ventricosus]|uniref:Uncharacterized protein n=1 Tax=Araneus ventricosus TaxID=182803 RepID=A0A4Y2A067_ARAVE|nr:hypothetical protein AVEN_128129-1 [Araneus ventricosus]
MGWNLTNAAVCVETCEYGIVPRVLNKHMNWYQVMVKHITFGLFVKEMNALRYELVVLPFWCLCDGCTGKRDQYRHMNLACELESTFKNIWTRKVQYVFLDETTGRSKKCHCIKESLHLVHMIQYISQRKASCDGNKLNDVSIKEEADLLSHFHMTRPLPEHAVALLCTLFPGGIEKITVKAT